MVHKNSHMGCFCSDAMFAAAVTDSSTASGRGCSRLAHLPRCRRDYDQPGGKYSMSSGILCIMVSLGFHAMPLVSTITDALASKLHCHEPHA